VWKRGKRVRQGSASALVGGRDGEGAPAGEAVANNGHEARRWNAIKGGKLIWAKRKGKLRRGVNLRLNCALIRGLKEGRGGDAGQVAGGALRLRAEEGRWRLGVTLTCGPQLTARARERRGALALVGRVGRKRGGRWGLDGPAAGKRKGKKKKREVGWAAGREMGWVCFFSFPILFKSFSNPLFFKFKSFTSFQIQIFNTNFSNYLKAFHKPFLTTFQIYFKFKPLNKFSQTFLNYF
jgi:hypothetical protein